MKSCAHCGAELRSTPGDEGLCASCLLRLGLDADVSDVEIVLGRDAHRVLGPIGRGPNGTVYLGCRMRDSTRLVTIKVIEQPIDIDVFLPLMTDVMARLPEEGTCGAGRLIDASITHEGRACVCAEYAPGPALDQYFAAHGPAGERLDVLFKVCELLGELHECGVAHGSVKPRNVIVVAAPAGRVPALLDVGLRPTIEASWISRREARAANRPLDVFAEHSRRADLDALDRMVCDLLDSRTDLSAVSGQIRANACESAWRSAGELAASLRFAAGQVQGL